MTDRPPWLTRKINRLRKRLFRRILLPMINRQLERTGSAIHFYDEPVDRLTRVRNLTWQLIADRERSMARDNQWYRPLLERGIDTAVILDVGGGGGAISAWFSGWARRVIVFEPSPVNRESIRLHHKIRGVTNADVVAAAVSDRSGTATLRLKQGPGHHSLGDCGASATVETIDVPVITLDEYAQEHAIERVGLLKIDVEGFEPDVICGADRLLRERRVELVLFEYSPAFYRERGIDPLAPIDELAQRGYDVVDLEGNPPDRERLRDGAQTDLLAMPGG